MVTMILLVLSHSFAGFEDKQVFYPEPVMAESTHTYDVLHYLVDVDLPMTSRYFYGAVTIAMRSNVDNLDLIDVYLAGLGVDSVKVNGSVASYTHVSETIWINLPQPYNQGDSFSVMVGYSGTPYGDMGYIFYTSVHKTGYTLGCPFATKRWVPCYDNLWDKADYGAEFLITVPDSYTVCANGAFLGKQVDQGYATYHWKHAYPIAPYLMHFASSIFTTYSDWYHSTPTDSLEIMYYFWPQDTIYTPAAFSLCLDMMGFLDSLYGDYPFERYGMDVIPAFYYGGMEHQSMAAINRSWLTSQNHYGIAHEMSHMWWGDMVTCFGWQNVWLNEGFATYSDALYLERREGHAAFIDEIITRRTGYFAAEQSNPHPIYDPPPELIFETGHTYYKASLVLHMIRYLCGDDETWLDLMAAYRDSFAYKNASTDDLNMIMDQVLAGDYSWFYDEWVYDMGYPIYDVLWNKVYESPNWRLVLDITQTQAIGPAVFHMPLPVGVDFSGGDTILTLPMSESPQHFEFVLGQEPLSVSVDPEYRIIQKNTVTPIYEFVTEKPLRVSAIQTVANAISIRMDHPQSVRVFDVTGRNVYKANAEHVLYRPSKAGIYFVLIGDRRHKVVVVN